MLWLELTTLISHQTFTGVITSDNPVNYPFAINREFNRQRFAFDTTVLTKFLQPIVLVRCNLLQLRFSGMTVGKQLGVQVIGIVSVAVWSAVATFVIVKLADGIFGLRVPEEEEIEGLDITSGFVVLGNQNVSVTAIGSGKPAVCNLADDRLDESILPALG